MYWEEMRNGASRSVHLGNMVQHESRLLPARGTEMAKRVAGEKGRVRRPTEGLGSARRVADKRARPGTRHEGRAPIEGSGYPTHRRLLTAEEEVALATRA